MNVGPIPAVLVDPEKGTASIALVRLLNDLKNGALTLWLTGTTAQRPVDPVLSQIYFDTTLGAFVYCSAIRNGAIAAVWSSLSVTTPIAGTNFTTVNATGAGTVQAPAWATACEIIMQAAGGGTAASGATSARGGSGSGEWMHRIIPVIAGNIYNYNVGAGAVNTAGGNTTFDVFTALGGLAAGGLPGAAGGGRLGPAGGGSGSPGAPGAQAVIEGVDAISGASGGGAGTTAAAQPGGSGGPCEERAGAAGGSGGGGLPGGGAGGSSRYGLGGPGGGHNQPGNAPAATAYGAGAGGPGAGTQAGAPGANGLLEYRFV